MSRCSAQTTWHWSPHLAYIWVKAVAVQTADRVTLSDFYFLKFPFSYFFVCLSALFLLSKRLKCVHSSNDWPVLLITFLIVFFFLPKTYLQMWYTDRHQNLWNHSMYHSIQTYNPLNSMLSFTDHCKKNKVVLNLHLLNICTQYCIHYMFYFLNCLTFVTFVCTVLFSKVLQMVRKT